MKKGIKEQKGNLGPISNWLSFAAVLFVFTLNLLLGSCVRQEKKLIVCCGRTLENAMEDIKTAYSQKYNIKLEIIYAGSPILLDVIKKTQKGDIFIPGSIEIINKAGSLVINHQYVIKRIPVLYVHKDNPKNIHTLYDLARPGIKLVIADEDKCILGKISEKIFEKSGMKEQIMQNIRMKAPTCTRIMDVIVKGEVDAGINMKHNLSLPEYKDFMGIDIPSEINEEVEVHVAVLKTSTDKKTAQHFVKFITSEGKQILKRHGFTE